MSRARCHQAASPAYLRIWRALDEAPLSWGAVLPIGRELCEVVTTLAPREQANLWEKYAEVKDKLTRGGRTGWDRLSMHEPAGCW
jgi:hypothetical protein